MQNLAFVIWMIGFPLVNAVEKYLYFVSRKETSSDAAKGLSAIAEMIIWAFVGWCLFER